jgi:hypothetical protein
MAAWHSKPSLEQQTAEQPSLAGESHASGRRTILDQTNAGIFEEYPAKGAIGEPQPLHDMAGVKVYAGRWSEKMDPVLKPEDLAILVVIFSTLLAKMQVAVVVVCVAVLMIP